MKNGHLLFDELSEEQRQRFQATAGTGTDPRSPCFTAVYDNR